MWICKRCGGTKFTETISGGYQTSIFNKEGECIEAYDQNLDFDEVMCNCCDNTGNTIQDIAFWEED